MKINYQKKLPSFIQLIYCIKKLFKNQDIRCIVSLNDVGETEKAFHEFNKNNIPSIVLQHGFIERSNETKNFDNLDLLISRINFQFGENIERNGYVTNLILNQIKLLSQEAQDMMIILPLEEKEIHKIKKLYF